MTQLNMRWASFWMHRSSLRWQGRLAMRLAGWGQPPYKARRGLARLGPLGYVSPEATLHGDCASISPPAASSTTT